MNAARLLPLLALAASLTSIEASSQPRRPRRPPPARTAANPQGDIHAVRSCSAVLATFAPLGPTRGHCPEIGCSSGLTVDMSGVAQPPGLYRVEVEADGQRFTCELRLPYASCDEPTTCVWRRAGTYDGISVIRANCAMPAASHNIPEIDFHGVCPSHVSARLLHEGREVGRWSVDPTYRRVTPGGENCGLMCAQGPSPSRLGG